MIGGFLIGCGTFIIDSFSGLDAKPFAYILFGTALGTIGSIIDSLLGATLQVTYFDEKKKVISDNSSKKNATKRIAGLVSHIALLPLPRSRILRSVRAHETKANLVCRLLLEKKKTKQKHNTPNTSL